MPQSLHLAPIAVTVSRPGHSCACELELAHRQHGPVAGLLALPDMERLSRLVLPVQHLKKPPHALAARKPLAAERARAAGVPRAAASTAPDHSLASRTVQRMTCCTTPLQASNLPADIIHMSSLRPAHVRAVWSGGQAVCTADSCGGTHRDAHLGTAAASAGMVLAACGRPVRDPTAEEGGHIRPGPNTSRTKLSMLAAPFWPQPQLECR